MMEETTTTMTTRITTKIVTRTRVDPWLVGLLALIALLHLATPPKLFYPGDNFAARAEAAHLLNRGELGFDYVFRPILGDLVEQRGQYFFENDARRRLASKYGLGNTLAYIPPLLIEKLIHGELPVFCTTPSLLRILNVWNTLWVLGAAAYLYGIARIFGEGGRWKVEGGGTHPRPLQGGDVARGGWSALFVVAAFYTTYAWYYLRAPALEIFQFLPFFGFVYHGLRALQRSEQGLGKDAAISILYVGALMLLKPLYAALLVPLWGAVVLRVEGRGWRGVIVPTLLVIAVLLAVNAWRYGSPWETGYGQWLNADGSVNTRLSPALFRTGFRGLFLQPLNGWNVFVYAPLFLFALFGIPGFVRRSGAAAVFVLAVSAVLLAAVCCTAAWTGAMAYGPRYALFAVLLGSLPVLEVTFLARVPRVCALGVMALALGASLVMQIAVIRVPYLAPDYVEPAFRQIAKEPLVDAYFSAPSRRFHQGMVYRDLLAHRLGRAEFPPLRLLRESGWAGANPDAFAQLQSHVANMSARNAGW
jgi:hypothetical protein